MIVSLVIPGEPAVKDRPRCGARVRSTARQKAAEAEIGRLLQARYIVPDLYRGAVALELRFFTASQTKDWDNMAKLCCDALNGTLWGDDRQVVMALTTVFRGASKPRTEIEVVLLEDGAGEVIARESI